ncbi:MAG: O-antigen ligase family protein [Bacteroidales bacterium]|nr:O-antigen ligase family protein [Bacteroidales bacterium]MBN2817630.1 O-antigen ligase family protein [Bacteroidales bacterium]
MKLSVWALVLSVVFLASFATSKDFTDIFITAKHFFFVFSLIPIVVLIFFKEIARKYSIGFNLKSIDIILLIYFLYITTNSFITLGNPLFNIRYINVLLLYFLYFLIRFLSSVPDYQRNFIQTVFGVLIILGVIQQIYGILQYTGVIKNLQLEFRIGGAFGNPGPYANFLSLFVPIYLSYILFGEKKNLKYFAWAGLVLSLIVLPLTMARTAWIASLVSVVYVVLHQKTIYTRISNLFNTLYKRIIAFVLLVIISVSAIVFLTSFKEDSASGRLFIWKVTVQMILDKPILGHGFNSYTAVHNDYQADYFRANPDDTENAFLADGINYAFNEYLQIASETGLIGLALFLSVFILIILNKIHRKSEEHSFVHIASEGLLIALLIDSFFSYPLQNPVIYAICLFAVAVQVSTGKSLKNFSFKVNKKLYKGLAFVFISLFIGFVILSFKRYYAEKEWVKAFQLVRERKYDEAQVKYAKLYPVMKYSQFFLFNYGAELSVMGKYRESIDVLDETRSKLNDSDYWIYRGNSLEALGDFAKAVECYEQASYIMPIKFYPKYRIALLFDKLGDIEMALSYAHEIADMKVKVESDIVKNIRQEMETYIVEHTEGF